MLPRGGDQDQVVGPVKLDCIDRIASDALRDGRLMRGFGEAVAASLASWHVATADGAHESSVRAFRT